MYGWEEQIIRIFGNNVQVASGILNQFRTPVILDLGHEEPNTS